jgi:hypothetical protein
MTAVLTLLLIQAVLGAAHNLAASYGAMAWMFTLACLGVGAWSVRNAIAVLALAA